LEYTWQVYVFTPTESTLNLTGGPQHGMTRSGAINPANSSAAQPFKVSGVFTTCDPCGNCGTTTPGDPCLLYILPTGSFNISVDLGFFTPNTGARTVFVEAFKNAAFSGRPAARTITSIGAGRPAYQHAVLHGLDNKQGYYVRAYVRANEGDGTPLEPGDGIALRKRYDPWGYLCEPEKNGWRYDPRRVTDINPPPVYWLPMYATDINNNRVADINEIAKVEATLGFSVQAPAMMGLLASWSGDTTDTTGSGLPDALEQLLGLGNHTTGNAISAQLREDLGLGKDDTLQLVIHNMPKTTSGGMTVEWALGIDASPGKTGGFKPLSTFGLPREINGEVLYALERTDSLTKPDWKVDQWRTSTKTEGGFTFEINSSKSKSGFYRVKMVEFPE